MLSNKISTATWRRGRMRRLIYTTVPATAASLAIAVAAVSATAGDAAMM